MSTKITLENADGTYSVESRRDELTVDDLLFLVVEPVLLAAGYAQESIDKALDRE